MLTVLLTNKFEPFELEMCRTLARAQETDVPLPADQFWYWGCQQPPSLPVLFLGSLNPESHLSDNSVGPTHLYSRLLLDNDVIKSPGKLWTWVNNGNTSTTASTAVRLG